LGKRLSQLTGQPIAFSPANADAPQQAQISETIRRSLADDRVRQTLARRFATTLLGRVGSRRLSQAQREAFSRWLAPAIGGEVRFDAVATRLLMARGSSDPQSPDFQPATLWLSSLAGPHS